MKKIIAIIISVIMIMGIMPVTSFAATEEIALVQIGDIKAPVAGAHPDYVATYGSGYNFITEFDTYGTSYGISWQDTTANKKMSGADVFEVGHVYRVSVLVKAADGYSFKKTNNYTTSVSSKINGLNASAYVVTGLNAGDYVGITYTFEACDYARISSVAVTDLSVPASGEKLDFTPSCKDDSYIVSTISWRDETANTSVSEGTTAIAGHKYEVEIWLRANDGYRFRVDSEGYTDVAAKIGAYNATVIASESEGVVVGITDSYIVPDDIKSVTVSGIDAPVTGAIPDTEATCGSGYVIKEINWVDKTGEYKDWISDITVFEAGRKYCVEVTLETISNYRFTTDYDGVTDVDASINGKDAIVYSDYSSTTVSIGYEFPLTETLPDVIINEVQVDHIDAPVAGETADAEASCGTDEYVITDIVWIDTTGEHKDWVSGIEGFDYGREYTVQITLKAEPGYKFATDDIGAIDVTGKINGKAAIVYSDYSDTTVTIGYEFPATEKKEDTVIATVIVESIDAPVAGAEPDTNAVCAEEGYEIVKIVWVDSTDVYENWIYGIKRFEVGRKYTVQVSLKATEGYKFLVLDGYNETKGVINGKAAIAYGSHSETELSIGFEFEQLPEEHKHEYNAVVTEPTCTAKGFTTYTCACGDTYTDNGTAMLEHSPEIIKGKPATKTETGLTDGEKCSACGTIIKPQEIIPVITEPVFILLGDVNNDGKITASDARLALRISARLDTADEYTGKAADMDGNEKITAADARKILRISAKLD